MAIKMIRFALPHVSLIKKYLILLPLLLFGFSLFAQTSRETKIFVQPVTGTGRQGDISFFYGRLCNEVVFQYYVLVRNRLNSDFMIRSSIKPFVEEDESRTAADEKDTLRTRETVENNSSDTEAANEFVFTVELINTETGRNIGGQRLIYTSTSDASVGNLISIIVYNLLSGIPIIGEMDDWRDKWLFLGLNGIWAPRIYTGERQSASWANFGLGITAEFHFLDFMSFGIEPQLVQDWVVVSESSGEAYTDLMLEIPLLVKFVLKSFDNFAVEPYLGASFNFSLTGTTEPSLCSWRAGIQLGIKAGPGMIIIDPRFSMDFTKSVIVSNQVEYSRLMINVALGYKFGLIQKNTARNY